jgi:hypothetical protein
MHAYLAIGQSSGSAGPAPLRRCHASICLLGRGATLAHLRGRRKVYYERHMKFLQVKIGNGSVLSVIDNNVYTWQ